MGVRTGAAAVLVAAALVVAAPLGVEAHASLVAATPGAGERLGGVPGAVTLVFSEPLNRSLSRAVVVAPDGRRFTGSAADGRSIAVTLDDRAQGVYEVRWTTVSAADGHVLSGGLRFGVGVSPAGGRNDVSPLTAAGLLTAAARDVEYAALLLAVGLVLVSLLAGRPPPLPWVKPRIGLTPALTVALAAGVAVVATEAVSAMPSPSAGAFLAYAGGGLPGAARGALLAAEAAAVALSLRGARRAAPAVGAALLALAAAGHAAAVAPPALGVATDMLHLLAAGAWAGGILALATVRPPGGWRRREARTLLTRFAPVALAAFGATAATGALRASQELTGLGDLLTTPYGQVLSAKAAAVAAMAGLSLAAWRWRTALPRLEGALALAVVTATAVLTAFPLPPVETRQPPAAARLDPALPRPGDLTLATNAGDALVGVTLRPGRPGRNAIWLHVLPIDGPAAAGPLPVRLDVRGRPADLTWCGPTCRTGQAQLAGGEHLDVQVAGARGGIDLPALPAPSAGDVLRRIGQRMSALRSYRIDETIEPASPPFEARFAFEAPNRMAFTLSSGAQVVLIGPVRYSRDRPDQRWTREPAPAVQVPSFAWDAARPVAALRVATAETDGQPVEAVSFFEGSAAAPIWYRLWVDAGGLVRRVDMWAQGHFMVDRYSDFDTPISVQAPVS
jgi:copper transport protein